MDGGILSQNLQEYTLWIIINILLVEKDNSRNSKLTLFCLQYLSYARIIGKIQIQTPKLPVTQMLFLRSESGLCGIAVCLKETCSYHSKSWSRWILGSP